MESQRNYSVVGVSTIVGGATVLNLPLFCIGAIVLLTGCAPQRVEQAPTKWEYQILDIPDPQLDTQLNTQGALGWEVIYARRADTSEYVNMPGHEPLPGDFAYEIIFKRPRSRN